MPSFGGLGELEVAPEVAANYDVAAARRPPNFAASGEYFVRGVAKLLDLIKFLCMLCSLRRRGDAASPLLVVYA